MRGDDPNDHTDHEFDRARIMELGQMHGAALIHLSGFTDDQPCFETHERRLTNALTCRDGGDTPIFTGVMCGSYHDVWDGAP